jgi:hypothetical protein
MDKGIIIGVDYEASHRNLPFALFKIQTGTHLFLPPFLRYHLAAKHLSHALAFASNYADLVYFAHSLEILLHSVLEDEVDTGLDTLPLVIEFLDHFPESLDVVVSCARKTEVERWGTLFDVVGKPRELFERCLEQGSIRTAASYLLVLHTLEELDDAKVRSPSSPLFLPHPLPLNPFAPQTAKLMAVRIRSDCSASPWRQKSSTCARNCSAFSTRLMKAGRRCARQWRR